MEVDAVAVEVVAGSFAVLGGAWVAGRRSGRLRERCDVVNIARIAWEEGQVLTRSEPGAPSGPTGTAA